MHIDRKGAIKPKAFMKDWSQGNLKGISLTIYALNYV